MNVTFFSILLLLSLGTSAQEKNNRLSFDLIGNYAQTDNPIVVDTKTFSFKTGAVGLKASLDDEKYGKFHLQYGVAYSPSESASFHDAQLSGSITVQSVGYGYIYPIDIENSLFSFDIKINNVVNKHTGSSFTGTHNSKDVNATVNATSDFTRTSIGVNYKLNKDTTLTAGMGNLNWEIDAKASGRRIDKDITFSTDINAEGSDNFYFIESLFQLMNKKTKLGFRRSNLNTDTSNTLNEVYIEFSTNLY
jgi:hypothetical protein